MNKKTIVVLSIIIIFIIIVIVISILLTRPKKEDDNIPIRFYSPSIKYVSTILKIPEGIGSVLQYLLNVYLFCFLNNKNYVHTFVILEHNQQENQTLEDWNKMWNDIIISQFIPSNKVILNSATQILLGREHQRALKQNIEENQIHYIPPLKKYLDDNLNKNKEFLEHLSDNYRITNINTPCYFDKSKINIAIHIRNFLSTDTDLDPKNIREYFKSGSISDIFFRNMIEQITNIFPNSMFYLYCKSNKLLEEYKYNNIIVKSDSKLQEDLHHMILADIFIMSKSSLSIIANYYRNKISIIRQGIWHTVNKNTIIIDTKLSDEDLIRIKNNVNNNTQ
jgi:hypothetical protein